MTEQIMVSKKLIQTVIRELEQVKKSTEADKAISKLQEQLDSSEAVKVSRLAKAMYAKNPTYKGATPVAWDEVPLAVKRDWLDKARSSPLLADMEAVELVATVKAKQDGYGGTFVHWIKPPVAGMRLYTTPTSQLDESNA